MDRCPWRWTFGERSKVGYLLPVWRQSRRRFSNLGFNTKKSGWPVAVQSPWLDEVQDFFDGSSEEE
jgi:hypothetical protein